MAGVVNLLRDDENYNLILSENLERRILIFNDEVEDYVLEDYILYIIKWNREDEFIPEENRIPIKLYINSGGGSVLSANMFKDVIMQSKTPVIGVGFNLVASAAYHIYLACDERICFESTTILQHDGQIMIENSSKKAKDTMKYFDQMDEKLKDFVLSRTLIDSEFYDQIFDTEFYMDAKHAKELGVVNKIIGIDCDFSYIW